MRFTLPTLVRNSALLGALSAGLLLPPQALAQPVTEMLPETVDAYTLEDVTTMGEAAANATYRPEEGGPPITFVLAAGSQASELHAQLAGMIDDEDELTHQETGSTWTSATIRSEVIVFEYRDDVLIYAVMRLPAEPMQEAGQPAPEPRDADADRRDVEEAVLGFLEAFGPDRLADVRALGDAVADDDITYCSGIECFQEAVSTCSEAQLSASLAPSVAARYQVEGSTADGLCRITFVFLENPNPEVVDESLHFTTDPVDGFTQEILEEVMEGCLGGDEAAIEAYDCEGPLVGVAG